MTETTEPTYDFSLTNPSIKNFFDTGTNHPVSELLYLHSHPLIKPNFLFEVNQEIILTLNYFSKPDANPSILEKFESLAKTMGGCLPDLNETNAVVFLDSLREIYLVCQQINQNHS